MITNTILMWHAIQLNTAILPKNNAEKNFTNSASRDGFLRQADECVPPQRRDALALKNGGSPETAQLVSPEQTRHAEKLVRGFFASVFDDIGKLQREIGSPTLQHGQILFGKHPNYPW
jgi:hypothetical protein